jgi:hypothetical protein
VVFCTALKKQGCIFRQCDNTCAVSNIAGSQQENKNKTKQNKKKKKMTKMTSDEKNQAS